MTTRRFALAGLLALVACGWPLVDPDLAPAWDAYRRGDYATAYREWLRLARQGNATAQTHLGLMYYDGVGVPQDYAKAAAWLRKAAEQGEPLASARLAAMVERGLGVPQKRAQPWLDWRRQAPD